jgi:hypothetical protein
MEQPTSADLARRLDRLERESRRWKAFALVVTAAMAAVFIMGQASPAPALRTQSLEVVDPNGMLVASLGHSFVTNDDGTRSTTGGVLTIYRAGDKGQINLHFLDGPSLNLSDGVANYAELQVFPSGPELHFKAGPSHTYWPAP